MTITAEQVEAGQAVYTKPLLASYDLLVLGLSNRMIWRCPTKHLLALYDRSVTSNHLDVGVGTGFFLDRCRFPTERPRLALKQAIDESFVVGFRVVMLTSLGLALASALMAAMVIENKQPDG